jgi:hypothetical protein
MGREGVVKKQTNKPEPVATYYLVHIYIISNVWSICYCMQFTPLSTHNYILPLITYSHKCTYIRDVVRKCWKCKPVEIQMWKAIKEINVILTYNCNLQKQVPYLNYDVCIYI